MGLCSLVFLIYVGVGWEVMLKACPYNANLTAVLLIHFEFLEGKNYFFHLYVPIRSIVPGV